VIGRDYANNLNVARDFVEKIKLVPGAVDVHLHQIVDAPELYVDVDRVRASQLGLTEASIASALGTSLSSSFQVNPSFWSDPKTGIPYPVAVQTPEYRVRSMSDLVNLPLQIADKTLVRACPVCWRTSPL
jgi:Cation/multidrug efflux pump